MKVPNQRWQDNLTGIANAGTFTFYPPVPSPMFSFTYSVVKSVV